MHLNSKKKKKKKREREKEGGVENRAHMASPGKVQNSKLEAWLPLNEYCFHTIVKSGTVCTNSGEQQYSGTNDLVALSFNPKRKSMEICGSQEWT